MAIETLKATAAASAEAKPSPDSKAERLKSMISTLKTMSKDKIAIDLLSWDPKVAENYSYETLAKYLI